MKKDTQTYVYVVFIIVLVWLLSSCNGGTITAHRKDVDIVNYNNHQYIRFGLGDCAWGVHDPDCSNPKHCN